MYLDRLRVHHFDVARRFLSGPPTVEPTADEGLAWSCGVAADTRSEE
jgi:hypothetical protein